MISALTGTICFSVCKIFYIKLISQIEGFYIDRFFIENLALPSKEYHTEFLSHNQEIVIENCYHIKKTSLSCQRIFFRKISAIFRDLCCQNRPVLEDLLYIFIISIELYAKFLFLIDRYSMENFSPIPTDFHKKCLSHMERFSLENCYHISRALL